VNQDVTLYVGYDNRAVNLPNWIAGYYQEMGDALVVSDVSASPLHLWARDIPAGAVVMGGNLAEGASGAASMYVVLLRGQGTVADTTAPLISQVAVTNISDSAATIQWSTNELSDSRVEYGLTIAYGSMTPLDTNMISQHSLDLSGLVPGTLYHYRVWSADGAGNMAYSSDETFETTVSGDVTPPQIFSIEVSALSDTAATISWSTDELADSKVEYGLAPGSYDWSVEDTLLTLSHSLNLIGLTPDTQYHYRVQSQDAYGNASVSPDSAFMTKHELPSAPGKPEHFDD